MQISAACAFQTFIFSVSEGEGSGRRWWGGEAAAYFAVCHSAFCDAAHGVVAKLETLTSSTRCAFKKIMKCPIDSDYGRI